MTALENIKNEFIINLLIDQNKGVENIQQNLCSYEDYENLLQSAYEVIKNNPDDDITSIRKKMYETSGINEAVNHLIYEMEMAPSLSISYGTKNYQEVINAGKVNQINTSENSIYDLASISKLFTSISVLKLASENIIDLSKDVTYYDERFHNLKGVTLLSLLTFNTPLITKGRIDEKDISYEESKNRLYNIMVNENFLSTANPYTDLGAMVLKEVISKVTNQNFYDFVKENIIDKANMQKTSIFVNPQDLSYLAPTDNTIIYKNGEFIFRNIPLGTVNDEKAQILGQQANDFAGHAGLFSTSENMAKFAISLMKYDILSEKYLKSMSKNATGRFIEELNSYKQFFGQLCYSKNPNPKATEVYHPLSGTSFAMGGYTGNQFTLDPENNVFAFLGSNRTNNRVANISGFDKSKIKHFPNGKETILIGNKEYINSSSYSSKRDEALRCTLKLSLSYLFLEYYVNTLENEIDLTGTYSRHI